VATLIAIVAGVLALVNWRPSCSPDPEQVLELGDASLRFQDVPLRDWTGKTPVGCVRPGEAAQASAGGPCDLDRFGAHVSVPITMSGVDLDDVRFRWSVADSSGPAQGQAPELQTWQPDRLGSYPVDFWAAYPENDGVFHVGFDVLRPGREGEETWRHAQTRDFTVRCEQVGPEFICAVQR
jgi:hypothetical protein